MQCLCSCYDPEKDRVIYSRDVQFDDSGKPGLSVDTNSTTRHSEDADKLIIDFDSDDMDQDVVLNEETSEAPQPPRPARKETTRILWKRKGKSDTCPRTQLIPGSSLKS